METRRRTLAKALIWNLMGLLVMSVVGLATTGSLKVGAMTAAINVFIGFVMYVFYERVWSVVNWGRHV